MDSAKKNQALIVTNEEPDSKCNIISLQLPFGALRCCFSNCTNFWCSSSAFPFGMWSKAYLNMTLAHSSSLHLSSNRAKATKSSYICLSSSNYSNARSSHCLTQAISPLFTSNVAYWIQALSPGWQSTYVYQTKAKKVEYNALKMTASITEQK